MFSLELEGLRSNVSYSQKKKKPTKTLVINVTPPTEAGVKGLHTHGEWNSPLYFIALPQENMPSSPYVIPKDCGNTNDEI